MTTRPTLEHPVTIAGAGLAGSLMAVYCAQRGWPVRVLEQRADMRKHAMSAGRSINLALSTRGLTALERVGLADDVLEMAIPMKGRQMHNVDGSTTFQPYGRPGEHINSVSRRGLNELLMSRAEDWPDVEFHFETTVHDVNLETGAVDVTFGDGRSERLESSLVIGADGIWSAIRTRMQHTPRFDFSQTYLDHGYKEIELPPSPNGDFALEPNALHIWPRHDFMLIALPNPDRTFTCTLFLAFEGDDASFDALADDAAIERFFHREFPDIVPLVPDLVEQFSANPTSPLAYIRCKPFHRGDRVVLIGDACHAVVPFYGQGMNAAFEDCRILDELLTRWSIERSGPAIAAYSADRKADADAISDLAVYNFLEMRSRVADEAFLNRKKVEAALTEAFPEHFMSLYRMVTFSNRPYAEARDLARQHTAMLDGADGAETALLALGVMRALAGAVPDA